MVHAWWGFSVMVVKLQGSEVLTWWLVGDGGVKHYLSRYLRCNKRGRETERRKGLFHCITAKKKTNTLQKSRH